MTYKRLILLTEFLLVFFLTFLAGREKIIFAEEISFTTNDHIIIWAKFSKPQNIEKNKYPLVILCHGMTDNYHYWDGFDKELLSKGYAILAIDNRGHGHSTNKNSNTEYISVVNFTKENYERFPLDIKAALSWLTEQPEIDNKRMGILGESLGANLAFVSIGLFPEIKTAIALSPYNWVLMGEGLKNFSPHSVLFICSEKEGKGESLMTTNKLFKITDFPKQKKIFNSKAHGQEIMSVHPEAKKMIFEWLEKNL